MGLYQFGRSDLFVNTLKTHPFVEFHIYSGSVFYNRKIHESGSFAFDGFGHSGNVGHVPVGHVSLFELNVDRNAEKHDYDTSKSKLQNDQAGTVKTMIHPFITKDGTRTTFKTVATSSFNEADFGSTHTASFKYPLSASIQRDFYFADATEAGRATEHLSNRIAPNRYALKNKSKNGLDFAGDDNLLTLSSSHLVALRNTLDHYQRLSPHYAFSASHTPGCDKGTQAVNLISIPSIFYGSSIKKGSVELNFYVSGAAVGTLKDEKYNGELIQTGPTGSTGSGSVAGVVLYNEGFVLLTASWNLDAAFQEKYSLVNGTFANANPAWIYWGTGIPGDATGSVSPFFVPSSSYSLQFSGTSYIPNITMLAHAPRGYLNHSNNPTFIEANTSSSISNHAGMKISSGSVRQVNSGSQAYIQNKTTPISNVVSSSYLTHTASVSRNTYISKIGIYDDNNNLIAIAKLARPVKKTEDRQFTFKLKLDI